MPTDPRDEKTPQNDPSPSSSPRPPETSPSRGEEEASSRAGAKVSPAEPAGFISDPGPAFEPREEPPPEPEPELHALPGLEPEWEERALSDILLAKGELLHTFAGVAKDDWRYTEADLKAIAPPLSRILNRYPLTRAAAGAQDPLALAIGFSGYAIRSGRERAAVLAERAAEPEEPITGVPAPPGAEPPSDHPINADVDGVDWQTR